MPTAMPNPVTANQTEFSKLPAPEVPVFETGDGTSAEIETIYAVVDSLAYNLKSIKKVCLLVDGEERETLAGHIAIDRPILPDFSLIAGN